MPEFEDALLDEKAEAVSPKPRRRGCLVVSLCLLLGLPTIFLLILNGPGFRSIARFASLKAAAGQGFSGDFKIEGSLWSGFRLHDIRLSDGTETGTHIEIDDIDLAYRSLDLIRDARSFAWFDGLRIGKATVRLVLPEPAEPEDAPTKPAAKKPGKPLDTRPLWGLLNAPIQIDDLTLLVQQGDRVWSLDSLQLSLPQEGEGYLRAERLALPDQPPVTGIEAKIRREPRRFEIGPLPLLHFANLDSLALSGNDHDGVDLLARIGVAGGTVQLSAAVAEGIPLNAGLALARNSTLDLATLALPGDSPSQLHGSVTDLDLSFSGEIDQPDTWLIKGKLIASKVGWDKTGVDSLLLLIGEERIDAEAGNGLTMLTLNAAVPYRSASALNELAALPLNFGLKLEAHDLAETLSGQGIDGVPLTGSAELELRDGQFADGRLTSGSLLLLTDSLAWDGLALDTAQIAAQVERADFVRLGIDLGLDESNHARVSATVDLKASEYEGEASVAIDTAGRLGTVLADLGIDTVKGGRATLDWTGKGGLSATGHEGEAKLELAELAVAAGKPITGTLAAHYADRSATLETLSLAADGVALHGTGEWDGQSVKLPDWTLTHGDRTPLSLKAEIPLAADGSGTAFLDSPEPVSLSLTLDNLHLDEITRFFAEAPPLPGTLDGRIGANGSFPEIDLTGSVHFKSDGPASEAEAAVPTGSVEFGLRGAVARPNTWETQIEASVAGLRWQGTDLENGSLVARTDTDSPGRPLAAQVRFDQSGTRLEADTRLDLATCESFADLASAPLHGTASLEISEIARLFQDFAPPQQRDLPLAGAVSLKVDGLTVEQGSVKSGSVHLLSETLRFENQPLGELRLDARVARPDEIEADLLVAVDEHSRLEGRTGFHLKEQTYYSKIEGKIDLAAKDSRLRRIVGGRALADLLPETAALGWTGKGRLAEPEHAGDVGLRISGLRLAAGAEPVSATVEGSYTRDSANFPVMKIASRPLNYDGFLRWTDHRLELNGTGTSGGKQVLSLETSIPADPAKFAPKDWFAQDDALKASIKANALPIGTLSRLFQPKPPILADLDLDLTVSGTPSQPMLESTIALDGITVPQEGKSMPVGRLDLKLAAKDERFTLDGGYRHPDVQPLAVKAAMPFHPGAWATGERKVGDEALDVTAKMDRSSLAFLQSQVPGIESIVGDLSLDATISGTVAAPQIRGSGGLSVNRLRLENRLAPSLQDVDLVAHFRENRIVLERLSALVAGGTLEGSGEAVLAAGQEPQIQLGLKGSEVLVFRNTDVSVRTDLDLRLDGPFSKATLSGEIGLTNCRYFRNFDLLPVGFPMKRSTSVLPTVERSPRGGGATYQDLNVGVPIAPFSDWPLSLRIHTKDPFLIRSNLLESSVNVDLSLGGTLGQPAPLGQVSIAEGEMSLPFSKVDVETGRIEFDAATGFNGAIEFKAKGKADRYQIAIYLYDRILSPQYVLTSIPPMPSEDILTLLATGTTRSDLVGEDAGSVAAGKAAGLFLKNLRKKGNKVDKERSLLDLLEERTELELGRVNQETGEQTFGGKIRLWKQLFFVGDVDAESDYRALLKYVFRFK
ncbi:MAG TPA: translocation/assembly module TamB domain-containing protein [Bacteroidia bacterium]|nr:translocation/assembly module TamB domain-containing protein [Bacteroidia bacterium]